MFHTVTMDPIGFFSLILLGVLLGMLICIVADMVVDIRISKRRIQRANNLVSKSLKRVEELQKEGE